MSRFRKRLLLICLCVTALTWGNRVTYSSNSREDFLSDDYLQLTLEMDSLPAQELEFRYLQALREILYQSGIPFQYLSYTTAGKAEVQLIPSHPKDLRALSRICLLYGRNRQSMSGSSPSPEITIRENRQQEIQPRIATLLLSPKRSISAEKLDNWLNQQSRSFHSACRFQFAEGQQSHLLFQAGKRVWREPTHTWTLQGKQAWAWEVKSLGREPEHRLLTRLTHWLNKQDTSIIKTLLIPESIP